MDTGSDNGIKNLFGVASGIHRRTPVGRYCVQYVNQAEEARAQRSRRSCPAVCPRWEFFDFEWIDSFPTFRSVDIPYTRMVAALSQITSIPEHITTKSKETSPSESNGGAQEPNPYDKICMDELLRETILSTFAFSDPSSFLFHDTDACDLRELVRIRVLSKNLH